MTATDKIKKQIQDILTFANDPADSHLLKEEIIDAANNINDLAHILFASFWITVTAIITIMLIRKIPRTLK